MPTTLLLKLAACLALAAALLFGWHELTSHFDQQGYQRAKAEDVAAAEAQTARNRELQRAAETKYVVQAATREKFFVTTVREVHDAAAPLAVCPLPADLRSLLDAADACARADPGAAGCTAGDVPPAR